jgi:death-on-curing protein
MLIVWIEKPLALAMHDRQLAEHGGAPGVRDGKLLESALARPQQLYAYGDPAPDLADLAASLACGLARNHPFVDGNKRTAAVACETFIMLNDGLLEADNLELYPIYIALAEGTLLEKEFAAWLRWHIAIAPNRRVNEERARYDVPARRTRAPGKASKAVSKRRRQSPV